MTVSAIRRLVWLLIVSSSGVFSADHICPKTENYTVTSMETYTEPVIVNTFTWCLQIPPRCPKTRTVMRQRYRVKTETKTRIVNECCEGYKVLSFDDEETGIGCVPSCEKCLSGVCISPNQCQCIPGYRGDSCETACPPGTWGPRCKEKCDCTEDVPCDPVNGHCVCPAGLRGQTCNESCPDDRWGPECRFPCDCRNSVNKCHPETGRCNDDNSVSMDNETSARNTNDENSVTVNFAIVELDRESSNVRQATEGTTEEAVAAHETLATTDNSDKTNGPEDRDVSISDLSKIRTQTPDHGNSSTARPVIVLVSVPERRRNLESDRGKFAMKNPFVRHADDNANLRRVVQPKTDYVKNIHKDVQSAPPIPLDIALIVLASIVSLGLTSVAVVMVVYMRSKLLEATRISIYEEGKTKGQENSGATRISSIVASTLPQTPVRLGPLFASALEPRTVVSADSMELSNNYANGAATIGLRISNDLHDLPQDDHYDRPPATRIHLQSDIDANTEHVYDEIPLQSSPLNSLKNA